MMVGGWREKRRREDLGDKMSEIKGWRRRMRKEEGEEKGENREKK